MLDIKIIGGGWVGCHLALKLMGEHNVSIYERNDKLFTETSFKNQNRLHLGFHYARNSKTRKLCKDTFQQFLDDYGFMVRDVEKNLYCVPIKNSLIDYDTYLQIFNGYDFCPSDGISDTMEGCIITNEKYIDFQIAHDFFNEKLKKITIFKNIEKFELEELMEENDLIINCTNNFIKDNNDIDSFYELTISLLYEKINKINFGALTLVDGKLFSIYPYKDNLFTLTDVEYTPILKFENKDKLNDFIPQINEDFINNLKEKFERKVLGYYPEFTKNFKYHSYILSTKSKFMNASDNRYPVITKKKNLISCFTGKIQGIYIIEKYIKNEINNREHGISG
jgi:FAD dependent oxidoreductase